MIRPMLVPALLALLASAGCGSSGQTAAAPTTTAATAAAPATATTAGAPGALQAEANATAAGDIPDNQTFLVFHDAAAGYSVEYPEGWAQRGRASRVTFRDKNNVVRLVVDRAPRPTAASVRADLARQRVAIEAAPHATTVGTAPAIKVSYSTVSAPSAVTGKRVKLVVDRYYLWKGGRVAVVDLGTPQGVDNVDAYRLMIESFRWS